MRRSNRWSEFGVVVVMSVLAASQASAQTVIDWTGGDANDGYNSVFNWAGLNVPNNTTESARFNLAGPFNVTIQSGLTQTVSDLIVQAGDINFAANGAIFATYSIDDDLLVTGGNLALSDSGGAGDVIFNVDDDTRVGSGGTLTIDGGSDLNTLDLVVGTTGSGDGEVVVDGPGSTLAVSSFATFGTNGNTGTLTFQNGSTLNVINSTFTLLAGNSVGNTGRLNVLSGSTLDTASIRVGSASSSASAVQEATVTVDGINSALTMAGASTLTVGDETNPNVVADVFISGGGTVSTGSGLALIQNSGEVRTDIGGTVHFNGDVTIDGGLLSNNQFPSSGLEMTFAPGTTLTIQNGGRFSELASRVLTGITINIDGTNSQWDDGHGTVDGVMNITNGGTAYMDVSFNVGLSANGSVSADGTGSNIRGRGVSVAGAGNTGSLTFSNNAVGDFNDGSVETVKIANSTTAGTTGTLTADTGADVLTDHLSVAALGGATTSGTVTVTGTGSTLTQDFNSTLVVGHTTDGTGTLNVNAGGVFTSGAGLGTTTINATGTVNIDGGTFNANGDVLVDGGDLNVINGGNFDLTGGRTVTVQNNGQIEMLGSYVIDDGTTFMVLSGGELIRSGAGLDTLNLDVATTGTDGTLIVDGSGSRVDIDISFLTPDSDWGANGGNANVTFRNDSSSHFNNINIATSAVPGTTANVLIESGADVIFEDLRVADLGGATTSAQITVTGVGSRLSPISAGSSQVDVTIGSGLGGTAGVDINDGGVIITGGGNTNINATGRVTVDGGRLESESNVTINGGTVELLSGEVMVDAMTLINGGSFSFTGGRLGVIDFQGTLVNQGGVLAPGDVVGTTIVNRYEQAAGGTLEMEIGGTAPGTQFDRLIVSTDGGILAGTLDLRMVGGFTPTLGDSFLIIETLVGNLSGTFSNVLGTDIGGGLGFDVIYGLNGITLQVISTALPGDLDGNGFVGINDLNIVLANWNQNVPPGDPLADPSGDGFVGIDDLNEVLGNWNAGTPPQVNTPNIPEPTTLAMLGVCVMPLIRCRRV